MTDPDDPKRPVDEERLTARPIERRYPLSTPIRITILAAVAAATAFGAIIAYAVASLDCRYTAVDECVAEAATLAAKVACDNAVCTGSAPVYWAVLGAAIGLAGSTVVAVLVARSFGEWQMLRAERRADSAPPGPATC